MVALVATSCKKNEGTKSIDANIGEVSGYRTNPDFDGSKAHFDPSNYQFIWDQQDQIMVYNLSNSNPSESECAAFEAENGGSSRAHFIFADGESLGSKKDQILVFYPAAKAERMIKENGNNIETFKVEATQTYNPTYKMDPNSMVMAAVSDYATNDLGTFQMQHIFGFVNIGVAHNKPATDITIDRIVITDPHTNLTGELDLKLPEVDPNVFTTLMNELESGDDNYASHLSTYLQRVGYHAHGETVPQGKSVTLNCNQALTYGEWTNFYIALRPGALYKGFRIDIYCNGSTTPTFYKEFNGTHMNHLIKPGYFRNFYFLTNTAYTDEGGYYTEQN
jgi:hypothetical protein